MPPGAAGKSGPRINAGGATFVDPIMQKWSGEYRTAKKVEIDYVAKGSGYGISKVTSRTLDFGCSDAPMNAKEVAAAKEKGGEVVHIPVTIGAVAVIFNVPEVKELKLTGEVVADIYLRQDQEVERSANRQAQPGDRAAGPGDRRRSAGPSRAARPTSSPSTCQSGARSSPRRPARARARNGRHGGIGKEGNDGIAEHVKNNEGTIGYVELAYASKNGINYATLVNKSGKPVAPDADSVTAAAESAMAVKQDKEPYSLHPLTYSFTDADGDAAYPIVGASYAIFFKKLPKDKGPVIVEFLKWVGDGRAEVRRGTRLRPPARPG